MKTGKITLLLLFSIVMFSSYSCKRKGECKCGSLSVEGEYDSKDEYEDAKAACQLLDCEWKKVL